MTNLFSPVQVVRGKSHTKTMSNKNSPGFLDELEAMLNKVEREHIAPPPPLLGIPGLLYLDNFLSSQEERDLLAAVDKEGTWNTKLARRTQHYGYVYDYSSKGTKEKASPIPAWCEFVIERLLERQVLNERPDQMIVNEYVPGQGISPHVDNVGSFDDGIVSLSLGSEVAMDFIHNFDPAIRKKEMLLARRSAIALHSSARYEWRHGIAARKSDHGVQRGRRVSLTFRKMRTESGDLKRLKMGK